MSRTVRRVTADWKHPKAENGNYKPQFEESYSTVLAEWMENKAKWDNGSCIKKSEEL